MMGNLFLKCKLHLKYFLLNLKIFWNFIFTPTPKWVEIEGYEKLYSVSSDGDIYNLKDMKNVKTFVKNDGYLCVPLIDGRGVVKQHRVHRLVANAFVENKFNKKYVKHKDGNKLNNEASNLIWY